MCIDFGPGESGVYDPHDDAADEQRARHHEEAFQVFADHLREQKCRYGRDHKSNQSQAQGMREEVAVAAFSGWKGADEFQDAIPKINGQGKDRSQLDNDRVHLPKTIVQIDLKERFDDAQMRRRTNRKKFGYAFDNSQKHGK